MKNIMETIMEEKVPYRSEIYNFAAKGDIDYSILDNRIFIHCSDESKNKITNELAKYVKRRKFIEIISINNHFKHCKSKYLPFEYILLKLNSHYYVIPILENSSNNIPKLLYEYVANIYADGECIILCGLSNDIQILHIKNNTDADFNLPVNWLEDMLITGGGKYTKLNKANNKKIAYIIRDEILMKKNFKNWMCCSLREVSKIGVYIERVGRQYYYKQYMEETREDKVYKTHCKYDDTIGTKPIVNKIKTIDNQTKYWNLLEIRFNIIERGRDRSILFNLLKKNMKDIINNEVLPIVKEKIGEEYLKFLTIGSITFTNTSELIITIRYKGDGKCPM